MTSFFRIALFTVALGCTPGFMGMAQAADLQLRGALAGENVVSATESPATGEVAAVLGDDDTLRLDLIYAGLVDNPTGAALHIGKGSENGPSVQSLDIATDATEGRLVDVEMSLSPIDAARVRVGEAYVLITTIAHPDGAIRAQLVPQPTRLGDLLAPAPEGESATDAEPSPKTGLEGE